MKTRHQARALALQALFEIDSVGHKPDLVLNYLILDENLPEEGAQFAHDVGRWRYGQSGKTRRDH